MAFFLIVYFSLALLFIIWPFSCAGSLTRIANSDFIESTPSMPSHATTLILSHAYLSEVFYISLLEEVLVFRRIDTKEVLMDVKGILVSGSFLIRSTSSIEMVPKATIEGSWVVKGSRSSWPGCPKTPIPTTVILDIASRWKRWRVVITSNSDIEVITPPTSIPVLFNLVPIVARSFH